MSSEANTEVGSYFISNYPPFSVWSSEFLPEIFSRFEQEPDRSVSLGLYLHIPFCRKRCKFCYFRVYTNQNAAAIENYVQSLIREAELLAQQPGIEKRQLKFVYFGGGTPSYLSSRQLLSLRERLGKIFSWENADEVTFECEPGTLSLEKVRTLKEIGVTRVSLGIENFNDQILQDNGRAHLSAEVEEAYQWIQQVGFPQVNLDLIAGMIGETDENWTECVERVAAMQPDNITIYQMELPHNTLIAKDMKEQQTMAPVADWPTKRRWVNQAIDQLLPQGYQISSGNELVRSLDTDAFVYRDSLWRGADLLGLGVSSFGHFQGVHYQNVDQLEDYQTALGEQKLPIQRALKPTKHQLLIRELVLQMKEGHLFRQPFQDKFGVNIFEEFADAFKNQEAAGFLTIEEDRLQLTRKGLLQVDRLLPEYFESNHREIRYT